MYLRIKIRLLSLICFFLAGLVIFTSITFAIEDKIVAIVSGEAITQRDIEDYLGLLYFQLSSQYDEATLESKMKEAEKDVLDILVENKLIIQEARRQELVVDNSIVESELEDIKTRFKSDKEFEDELLNKGLSLAEIKKKIADKILMHDIVEREVRAKIFVHPQEVTDYYQSHLEDFKVEEQLDLDSIFIPFTPLESKPITASENAAKDTAYEVLALLKKGEDFSKIQKEYSETASLGLVSRAHLKKEIADAVSGLNIADISLPVRVEDGFFILKIKNIIPVYTTELSKVQDVIYGFLFQKKFEERFLEWIDELKNQAFILIK